MFINLHRLDRRSKQITKGKERGVYYTHDLNIMHYLNAWTRYRLSEYYNVEYQRSLSLTREPADKSERRSSYGLADNVQQVLEHYQHLSKRKEQYFIILTPILRRHQSEFGGFRFHKWGKYIGTHELNHEYLYNQTDIDVVYVYYIYEVLGTKPRPQRIGNRNKKLNIKKKQQSFYTKNFSKRGKKPVSSYTTFLKRNKTNGRKYS